MPSSNRVGQRLFLDNEGSPAKLCCFALTKIDE